MSLWLLKFPMVFKKTLLFISLEKSFWNSFFTSALIRFTLSDTFTQIKQLSNYFSAPAHASLLKSAICTKYVILSPAFSPTFSQFNCLYQIWQLIMLLGQLFATLYIDIWNISFLSVFTVLSNFAGVKSLTSFNSCIGNFETFSTRRGCCIHLS